MSSLADPNDKAVDPAGETPAHYTLMKEELMYTIRFQNTGNDTAFNVRILDTLDASLDLTTLQVLGTSHSMSVQMSAGGEVEFSFPDILLPDSIVDEPGSHGYVVYSIKPFAGLTDGTMIENTAHIIFDLNPAVVTNTTWNTFVFSIPTGITENSWSGNGSFFPNPVKDEATIKLQGRDGQRNRMTVYNGLGECMLSKVFTGESYLMRADLSEGIYMLSVTDDAGRMIYFTRFISK